jgi:hypothetical protein
MYNGISAILPQRRSASTLEVWKRRSVEKNEARKDLFKETANSMKKYIIEREIPQVGTMEREQLRAAAAKSNETLRALGPDIQWLESFVAADKTFCVYLAKDEAIIRRHAELSGFPATKVTEISKMIDPTTEAQR